MVSINFIFNTQSTSSSLVVDLSAVCNKVSLQMSLQICSIVLIRSAFKGNSLSPILFKLTEFMYTCHVFFNCYTTLYMWSKHFSFFNVKAVKVWFISPQITCHGSLRISFLEISLRDLQMSCSSLCRISSLLCWMAPAS